MKANDKNIPLNDQTNRKRFPEIPGVKVFVLYSVSLGIKYLNQMSTYHLANEDSEITWVEWLIQSNT